MLPLHQIAHVGVSQSRGLKLFGREVILEEFQPMSSRYLIVTDGQTDGHTDRQTKAISIPRYALVHRAVKTVTVLFFELLRETLADFNNFLARKRRISLQFFPPHLTVATLPCEMQKSKFGRLQQWIHTG